MKHEIIIDQLRQFFLQDPHLHQAMITRLQTNATDNPDPLTNPVRSMNDLMHWLQRFLTAMPWEGLEQGTRSKEQGLFRKIDQATGYFYYLFGDLQFEPAIAEWIKKYNAAWGEFLNSSESWNDTYFELLKSDPLFELDGDKYESADNWHCWNDFFSRRFSGEGLQSFTNGGITQSGNTKERNRERLESFATTNKCYCPVAEGVHHPWLPIKDNTLDVKTSRIEHITDLLGNSPYKQQFENGEFMHITLDICNYHRFHSPIEGRIVDIQEIDGSLSAGGKIIWDKTEHRYRYEQVDNIGFQMIEKRVALVIESKVESRKSKAEYEESKVESGESKAESEESKVECEESKVESRKSKAEYELADQWSYSDSGLTAVIPVGVAQVGSIRLNEEIKIGTTVEQGQELGYFLCGGSDVVIMKLQ